MVSRFHLFICSRFVHICLKLYSKDFAMGDGLPHAITDFFVFHKITAVYCPNHVADVRYPLQPRSMVGIHFRKNQCSQMKTQQNPAGLREFSKIRFLLPCLLPGRSLLRTAFLGSLGPPATSAWYGFAAQCQLAHFHPASGKWRADGLED